MRSSAARRARRVAAPLAALIVLAGVSAVIAAERSFPYDSTLLLEARPMKGSKRVPILQIESKGEAFHERLREGFLSIARAEPGRCATIDATGSVDEVEARVWAAVNERLAVHG